MLHPAPPPRDPEDGSTVHVRGVTGAAVAVTGLDEEPQPVIVTRTLPWRRAVRPRLLLTWTGMLLLTLAGALGFAAAAWHSPSIGATAGASGLVGSITLLSGASRY